MYPLRQDELERNRRALEAFMTIPCRVLKPTGGRSQSGGRKPGPAVLIRETTCSKEPIGSSTSERVVADKLTEVQVWKLSLPAETPLEPHWQIELEGQIYEIGAIIGPHQVELSVQVIVSLI